MPEKFGSWKGVLRKWAVDGTWEKVFTTLLAQADGDGDLNWVVAIVQAVLVLHHAST
ncbi:transposase [Streptomyces sp. LN785]|uniref:transposase n=1 Tax=Streptomyces sp. LN785 TaxID=3112983 RepID=UPI0037176AFF